MMLLKALFQGAPATGKTGCLAAAVNAGYRLVVADFDHNMEPVIYHTNNSSNIHVIPFHDTLTVKDEGGVQSVSGEVSAFRRFTKFLVNGTEALGKPKEWGPDTILVADSLSSMVESAMRRILRVTEGRTREGQHVGILADEVESMLELLMTASWNFHRVLIAHLKLLSPQVESMYPGETDLQKKIKQERAELEETAYVPYMPGRITASTLARRFSTALLFELDEEAKASRLVMRTRPIKGYTIKVPVPVPDKLPIETGIVTILKELEKF